MDNRKNNGGHSTKGFAGRHSKSTEQEVIENLSLLDDLCWQQYFSTSEMFQQLFH